MNYLNLLLMGIITCTIACIQLFVYMYDSYLYLRIDDVKLFLFNITQADVTYSKVTFSEIRQ